MSGQGLMIEAWRQGLMKRPCRSAANWLAFMAFPAWLLTALLAASWGIALPTVTWAFSCRSFMKEMHHRLAHRLIWWGIFSAEITSSKVTLGVSGWHQPSSTLSATMGQRSSTDTCFAASASHSFYFFLLVLTTILSQEPPFPSALTISSSASFTFLKIRFYSILFFLLCLSLSRKETLFC